MDRDEARNILETGEVVPFLEGPIADIKELASACLDADIAVDFGRYPGCGKG